MKKSILTKLGLLMVASFMVTGCSPTPAPAPSSSAPASSSEEPLPPEDEHVDLTYPLVETEINEISDEEFAQQTINSTGSTYFYETMKGRLGDYFYDFLRTHNHMTNDEFGFFLSAIYNVTLMVDDFNGDYHIPYNVVYALAYIDADNLTSTIKELQDDGTAWGFFINMVDAEYYPNDYINVDYVADGQSSVHELAEEEAELLAANPYAVTGSTFNQFLDHLFDPELAPVFVRFAHRFARSMIRNLSEEEFGFLLYSTILGKFTDTEIAQDIMDRVGENLLEVVHNVGAWLTELDVGASTYKTLYPLIDYIFQSAFIGGFDLELDDSFFIATDWYEEVKGAFIALLENANPEGLRVLFKFLGMLATNINEEQLNMFFVEDMEEFDGQIIVDLYNEQYGLLTGEEKAAFTDFFAAFGIDFDEFIERLKEYVIDPTGGRALVRESDEEEESIFEEIINECVVYPFLDNFPNEYPDYFCKYRDRDYVPILKEGTTFTEEDFEEYLQEYATPVIGIRRDLLEDGRHMRGDETGDYVYEKNDYKQRRDYRHLVETEPFDTTTSGVKEVKFTVETVVSLYDHWDSETQQVVYIDYPIEPELTMRYMVVPATIEGIHTNDNELYVQREHDSIPGYNGIITDNSGNPLILNYTTIYLVQNASYAADDFYVSFYERGCGRYFDSEKNRFVVCNYSNEGEMVIKRECEKVHLNELDTSVLGDHFVTLTTTYSRALSYEDPFVQFASEKGNFRYTVVESLEKIPGVDISMPIK